MKMDFWKGSNSNSFKNKIKNIKIKMDNESFENLNDGCVVLGTQKPKQKA